MENLEIDEVMVDIPDTPDRVTSQRINCAQFRKESNSSVAGHSRTSDFRSRECLNESKPRGRTVSENGYNSKLHLNHGGVSLKMDESEPCDNNSTAFSSQNFPLFRRGAMVNNFKLESRPSASKMQHVEKGKAQCKKVSSKSPVCIDEDTLFNIALSCGASKVPRAEGSKDVQVSSMNGYSLHSSPVISSKALKGKAKADFSSCADSGSEMNHGRGNDSSCNPQPINGKQKYPSYSSFSSPRVAGKKRLVRNGCISPYNIVSKTQNLAKIHEVDASNDRKVHSSNMVPDAMSEVPIKEIVAEEKNDKHDCSRAGGKGVMIYPSTSKEHDRDLTDMSTSRIGTNQTACRETNDRRRTVLLDGWRSTRNRSKEICHADDDDDDDDVFVDTHHESRVTRRNEGSRSVMTSANGSRDQREAQTASRLVTGVNQISQPQPIGNIHTKRQKKHGLPSRNQNRGSKEFPEDSEIVYLGSSEESSTSRSSRGLNAQRQSILDTIYEIDEPTPERRTDNSRGLGSSNEEDEVARAIQVEADEILARELQEEMYRESPIFGGSEVDENLAWLLQEDDDIFPTAFLRDNSLPRARNAMTHANRQPQPLVSRNCPNRRGSQVRVPTTRTSQLRSRLFNRSPTGLSRSSGRHRTSVSTLRNFQFPAGMDIDMRLDILGALEDAVGEFNDLSMTATNIHHVQRDFNEDDYEMLLALDDNINQHGLSANRINTLPETVVQTENFDECAICLETPSIGETIRHLPCLHKFHKECIDPWLSRRTSCPVCKSSIT